MYGHTTEYRQIVNFVKNRVNKFEYVADICEKCTKEICLMNKYRISTNFYLYSSS